MKANRLMKKTQAPMKKPTDNSNAGASASQLIDARIKELGDWRGETLRA